VAINDVDGWQPDIHSYKHSIILFQFQELQSASGSITSKLFSASKVDFTREQQPIRIAVRVMWMEKAT